MLSEELERNAKHEARLSNIFGLFLLWISSEFNPRFFTSLRMRTAMERTNRSPRIQHVSWGRLEVEGKAEPYKDAKLFPGGSREWNWRETKTAHRPGIQIADVQELVEHGSKVVVLSRGMAECLHVPQETLDFLKERQVAVHILPTQHAVPLYNKLAQSEAVGGLFHTTC
jgi:Uncharacterized conserved protein